MSRLETALAAAVRTLSTFGTETALVGGLAVSARTEPRFTRDLDLAVAVTNDADAESLVGRLVGEGYRAGMLVEQDVTNRLASVRVVPPHESSDGVVIDLLFASSGIEPEIIAAADAIAVFPAVVIPVARIGHLVALKLLSRDDRTRPQDAVDLRNLALFADDTEIARARQAVALIEARGFARGRDLRRTLDDWNASRT